MQHPHEQSAVVLCVSIATAPIAEGEEERWVTSIGLATLDTHALSRLSPGDKAKNWYERIRLALFAIEERMTTTEATAKYQDFEGGDSKTDTLAGITSAVEKKFDDLRGRNILIVGHSTEFQQKVLQEELSVVPNSRQVQHVLLAITC